MRAYRKFLKGDPLIEAEVVASLMERLPPKMRKIQQEFPAWLQRTGNREGADLMQALQKQYEFKNFEEVEKAADAILKLMSEQKPSR
jgi:hypothetical protein